MNNNWQTDLPSGHLNINGITPTFIEAAHKQRENLLQGILQGDVNIALQIQNDLPLFFGKDALHILKRVPNNKLRSYKNILLSHNTLYSYMAEKGGLSPWQCHFTSEKYAIMIEHAEGITELETLHLNMINEYADPSVRISNTEHLSIVEMAANYIEMNFAENISIEELAKKLHVHPSHLMRSFKKEKGITISNYRNLRRLKVAKELIIYSNLSMTDIAVMIGFSNPQYFSTFFKEVEGMTPVAYKRLHKNNKSST